MEWLDTHWDWLATNPKGAITLALVLIGGTWLAAKAFYRERIDHLKERLEAEKAKPTAASSVPDSAEVFEYPPGGRHGRNLLSNGVQEVAVGEHVSLRAQVPRGTRLHVVLRGLPPIYLEDTSAGWNYSLGGITNWSARTYRGDAAVPEQHFDADGGVADLDLTFARTGDLFIEVFEGTDQVATWSRKVRVVVGG